jgi:hypothetical protein
MVMSLALIALTQTSDATGAKSVGEGSKLAAKAPANQDLAPQVRRLLRQLDAGDIAARDAAYAELLKLGPEIVDLLPKATDNAPATVRDAVKRLRREFDKQAADVAIQASTVTLKGDKLSLKTIAAEFEKQTGNKVDAEALLAEESPLTKATYDMDFEKVSFWKALDAVADQAGLSVYSYAQDMPQLRPGLPNQKPRGEGAIYSGPLRFQVHRLQLERDPRLKGDGSLKVGLEICWEPRLRPISIVQKLDALRAVDENGGAVSVERQGDLPVLVPVGSTAVELELPLTAPPRSVKSIASLKGAVEVLVPGPQQTFEFTSLVDAKKSAQQKHNATVSLDSVRKANDVWEVRLRVKYEEPFDALDSYLVSWILNNEAYLTDPKGARVENGGFETTHRTEDEIGVAYFFEVEKGLDGHKFVYQTPGTIYRLPIDYELKELFLP